MLTPDLNETSPGWDLHISSRKNLFQLNFEGIWNYRDLLWLLVKRDFVSFYKQTILGPLWFFVQPLLTTGMFTVIFGYLGGFSTDGLPKPLFYLTGITAWNYFADCLTKTATVFKDNANIFGKVYFPRLIMPLSIVVSNLVRFGVQLILLLAMLGWYAATSSSVHVTWAILLFPVLLLLMALLGLGAGMLISALTTKYRDLIFLLAFGVQLLMYSTTVIYPLSTVGVKYQWLIRANPMTGIIESFRYGFLGVGSLDIRLLAYSITFTVIVLLIGILTFNKVEKDFVDTV